MIVFEEVSKQYNDLLALADVSIEIENGEFIFLSGPSGAGKSTLLKLIIREETPTNGKVFVDGVEVSDLPSKDVHTLRRRIGTIFQDFKLLQQRTVFENVAFPMEILGMTDAETTQNTMETLALVNLENKAEYFPTQLSGGEAQRTAIARAMVLKPEIILADEPTGNLDAQSAWEIMQILGKLHDHGTTIIMATHNLDISSSLPHRSLEIKEGRVLKDSKIKKEKETKEKSKQESASTKVRNQK